jgi:hypothetical protein
MTLTRPYDPFSPHGGSPTARAPRGHEHEHVTVSSPEGDVLYDGAMPIPEEILALITEEFGGKAEYEFSAQTHDDHVAGIGAMLERALHRG